PIFAVDRIDDLTYGSAIDEFGETEALKLDLFLPRGDTRKRRPVMVWAHGGSFTSGDKSSMRWIPEAWAKRGYVVASINYRLNEGLGAVTFPVNTEEVLTMLRAKEDMQGAVRWLRGGAALFKLDPDKV